MNDVNVYSKAIEWLQNAKINNNETINHKILLDDNRILYITYNSTKNDLNIQLLPDPIKGLQGIWKYRNTDTQTLKACIIGDEGKDYN